MSIKFLVAGNRLAKAGSRNVFDPFLTTHSRNSGQCSIVTHRNNYSTQYILSRAYLKENYKYDYRTSVYRRITPVVDKLEFTIEIMEHIKDKEMLTFKPCLNSDKVAAWHFDIFLGNYDSLKEAYKANRCRLSGNYLIKYTN